MAEAEQQFLIACGRQEGLIAHLDDEDRDRLRVQLLSAEAMDTSEIEGEILDRASVQSSIQKHLGLAGAASPSVGTRGEDGVARMMIEVYRDLGTPLTRDRLFDWHRMLLTDRRDLRNVGRYRTDPRPMQIISGRVDRPMIHFEAVPTERADEEMERFLGWLRRTGPNAPDALPALTRAGIAHVYFESIHPFEDGNGRIGRALSERALAEASGAPRITALASTTLLHKAEYYQALNEASRTNNLSTWLAWFGGLALEAQQRTIARAEFLLASVRLVDRLSGRMNERQEKALRRMIREGPDGFVGGMSASKYISLTGASPATARRDLSDLVDLGALRRTGERKGTRYHLTIPLNPIDRHRITSDGRVRVGSS